MAGVVLAGGGDGGAAPEMEQGDREIAEGGERLGCVRGAGGGPILTEDASRS
jgi:hypothetical protein